ncbi:MAG TPA: AEC family transporter [Negativicutes bacterium]|nr:AEC family transporter [Negativicutes bacterium]
MPFFQALQGVLVILIIVGLGYLLTRKGWLGAEAQVLFPRLINYVALPTYMTWNLLTTFDQDKLLAILPGTLVPLLAMAFSFAVGYILSRLLGIPRGRRGAWRSMFFVSSAIFVGLPVNVALFGESSIPYVLLYFLPNAFLFWSLGVYCISTDGKLAGSPVLSLATVKSMFSPPLTAFTLATVLVLVGVKLPPVLAITFKSLGAMTIPLSLLFIGMIIHGAGLRRIRLTKDSVFLLLGRFVVSPLSVLLVAHFIPIPELMRNVFVIQAAMPAMTQTSIIARLYGADTEYTAIMTSLTVIASLVAIPIYMMVL